MNTNLKLLLAVVYGICLIAILFIVFYHLDFKDLSDYSYIKERGEDLKNIKSQNLYLLIFTFFVFSAVWVLFLGFGSPIALLAGFILQILLELLSKGIEHGHVHHHGSITKSQLAIIFIGLCTHAFIEGIPIQSFDTNQSHVHANEINLESSFSWIYFTAILIHKLPIAIVLMFFLIKLEVSTLKKYLFLVLFSITTPLGAIIGKQLMLIESFYEWSPRFLALTTGMLLHITTLLIFEDHNHSKDKFKNLFIIIIGIVFGVCIF